MRLLPSQRFEEYVDVICHCHNPAAQWFSVKPKYLQVLENDWLK
jgi:hypothetical protein